MTSFVCLSLRISHLVSLATVIQFVKFVVRGIWMLILPLLKDVAQSFVLVVRFLKQADHLIRDSQALQSNFQR